MLSAIRPFLIFSSFVVSEELFTHSSLVVADGGGLEDVVENVIEDDAPDMHDASEPVVLLPGGIDPRIKDLSDSISRLAS
jgi:hypothetical protein